MSVIGRVHLRSVGWRMRTLPNWTCFYYSPFHSKILALAICHFHSKRLRIFSHIILIYYLCILFQFPASSMKLCWCAWFSMWNGIIDSSLGCVASSTVWYLYTCSRQCHVSTVMFATVVISSQNASLLPFHLSHLLGGNVAILGTSYSCSEYGVVNNGPLCAGHIVGVVFK